MGDGPADEAALLNPAFVASIISAAAVAYAGARGEPIDWAVAFVVPPLVLFSDARERLPKRASAHFARWVSANALLRLENVRRMSAMTPYTKRAIRFGARHGLLEVADGRILGTLSGRSAAAVLRGDAAEAIVAATFVGRWLAREEAAVIYALLGVRP